MQSKQTEAPVQEPVLWMDSEDDVFYTEEDAYKVGFQPIRPLYATPSAAQRQWVGLTDDDIRPLCKESWVFESVKQWAEIIEAKLKEKNTWLK